ncbi:ankyrin-2 [Colletotrichum spaethianum]|uniref:Ankyrin-2 n=1 Tax=Colletotrichum spaethianum TaxID=700344 RepID=A0AA37NYZ8_9PEZI|nr:ankyrin-2 [Colletotrichum spaethianum]GKT46777.1 ankyrin-2 [Colletotrichum spaethianum]
MAATLSDCSEDDTVVIDRDDVSNYNPEQILPESDGVIKSLRSWLKPTSYDLESGEYRKHLSSHVLGTGEWLTSSCTYADWSQGHNDGLLWITGIPGSGKSVLASKIVDELGNKNPGCPVLYFFFRQIIDANHEPVALLRDWLDQVLVYSPPLQKRLKEYTEKEKKPLSTMSMNDLWKDLRLALSGFPDKVFCVADALDEIDHGNEAFIKALADLGNWMPGKVKVLITSRPVPSVEIPLRTTKYLQIRLQGSMVDVDISAFVQKGLDISSILPEDQQIIREAIPGRANGLFLYAKLAMDAFLKPNANTKDTLKSLPADMNAMYADLLREHSRRSGVRDDMQRVVLQWATHATRPLRLLELAEMISVTYYSNATEHLRNTKDLVRAACGPLLEIMPDETVCVIHHSFTEYLQGISRLADDDTGYPVLEFGETHASLGLACLRYLKAGCLDHVVEKNKWLKAPGRLPNSRGANDLELNLKYPFLTYAANNWYVHLERSAKDGYNQTKVITALEQFFGNSELVYAWLRVGWLRAKDAISGLTPLHIAAKSGLVEYVKHLVSSPDVAVDAIDAEGKTALWWAASFGMAEVVQVLIEAGASPDQDDACRGLKPLHEASSKNYPEVIRVLLTAGVNPLTEKSREDPGRRCGNSPRSTGHTPLMYACKHGHLEAIEAYMPFLADNDEAVYQALSWAARSGRTNIVARLLEHPGIDINRKVHGVTPLFQASQSWSYESIKLLLNEGANPTIVCQLQDMFRRRHTIPYDLFIDPGEADNNNNNCVPYHRRSGLTALYMALDGRQDPRWRSTDDFVALKDLLTLFVEKGADIHQRTHTGQSLLHVAQNNPTWVRLLLDAGIDANVTNNEGCAPLHMVHSTESLTLLVVYGKADINKRIPSTGKTPLLQVVDTSLPAALQLIKYGADCTITDNNGNGPLHIALQSLWTNRELIKALIEGGADPNLKNECGTRPLDVMSLQRRESVEIMDLLLEAGANINAKDKNGATLLFRVVPSGCFWPKKHPNDDVKALLDRGSLLETRDSRGRTLLHELIRLYSDVSSIHSADSSKPSRFDFLRSQGLDVHVTDYDGNNLLHELCWHRRAHDFDSREIMLAWEHLLSLGLDVDQQNNRGRTPLHNLATKVQGEGLPIDLVISRTKNMNVRDRDGIAPLHLAVTVSEQYTKKLLDAGADPAIRTNEGLTPLHLASRSRQSNIVGLLLDALHQADGVASNVRSKIATRGYWLHNTCSKPVAGVNVADKSGYTPLYYACRSGRPEIVSMLFKAGAVAQNGNLCAAVVGFEQEYDLWLRRPVREPENGDAGGLKLEDVSRPWGVIGTRLAQGRRPLGPPGPFYKSQPSLGSFYEHLIKNRHEAIIKAIQESGIVKKGEANEDLVLSRLVRREYEVMEELFNLGVDFLTEQKNLRSSNLEVLVTRGLAFLVDRIGSLEAKVQFEKGIWHAAGDKTRPGFGLNTKWACNESSNRNSVRKPFLLQAVDQELPVLEVVQLLVDKFAVDTNELYINGARNSMLTESALHSLAAGHWWWQVGQALPYLISKGADLEIRNSKGQTPLHVALGGGDSNGPYHSDAAHLLILAGADVNAVDGTAKTCLGYARGNVDLIRLLIERGAAVKADAIFAAINGKQVDVLETLLTAGVSPNLRLEEIIGKPWRKRQHSGSHEWERDDMPDCEWYPVHHAASRYASTWQDKKFREELNETTLKIINILLSHGANPLQTFTRCSTKECYHQKFLAKEQAADLRSDNNENQQLNDDILIQPTDDSKSHLHEEGVVLHQLLVDGHVVYPFLTLPNIDANFRDSKGRTLFHAACFSRRGPDLPVSLMPGEQWETEESTETSLFHHLLSIGADLEARDDDGRNAIHHLLRFRLEERYCSVSLPVIHKSLAYMATYHHSIINQRDKDGKTPLYLATGRAVYEKNTTAAEKLLKAGADPLIPDNDGNTVLHVLSRMLWISSLRNLFEELVNHGCDVNSRNLKGETPLFYYFKQFESKEKEFYTEHLDGVTYDDEGGLAAFEAANADFKALDNAGQGLLHMAARGHAVRFKTLAARGLDPMIEDNQRKTALDVAAACGNIGVLRLFKRGDAVDDLEEDRSSVDPKTFFGL